MMTSARVVFIFLCIGLTGGAFFLSETGFMGESTDLDRSVRVGSGGGGYLGVGRVK